MHVIAGWMLCAVLTGCSQVREPYESSNREALRHMETSAASMWTGMDDNLSEEEAIIHGKRMMDTGIAQTHATHDVAPLMHARMYFESLLERYPDRPLIRYYIGYCNYHCALALMETNQDVAEDMIDGALEALEQGLENNLEWAEGWALLSSCYGIKASFGTFSGMTYGPKSGSAIEKARTLAPENPRVLLVAGINKFYTPSAFGGDKNEALGLFRRSAAIFDAQNKQPTAQPDWGHEEAYTYIGIVMRDQGDTTAARAAFRKVLAINPEFGWVKHVLLPELGKD